MELSEVLKKTRKKGEAVAPKRTKPTIAVADRPYVNDLPETEAPPVAADAPTSNADLMAETIKLTKRLIVSMANDTWELGRKAAAARWDRIRIKKRLQK